jgi:uncharacterized membrane protein YhfC
MPFASNLHESAYASGVHLIALTVLQLAIMIVGPIALVWWKRRRWRVSGWVVLVGATTFIASQVVHIPLNLALT